MSDYTYDAVVRAVHDGDTITVDCDLGFNQWVHGMKLRLYGINSPELNTPAGKTAQAFLAQQLPAGAKVEIRTVIDKQEKYGRILATVLKGGVDLNALMCASGNAKPYFGVGPKPV